MFYPQRAALLLGDGTALVAAFFLMMVLRFSSVTPHAVIVLHAQLFGILFLLSLAVFFIFDLYNVRRINPNPRNIGLLILATAINSILGVGLFYFSQQTLISPKTNLLLVELFSLVFLVLWRRGFYFFSSVHSPRRIAIIGTSPLIDHLIGELALYPQLGIVTYHWGEIPETLPNKKIDLLIAEHVDPRDFLSFSRFVGAEVLSLSEAYESLFAKIPLELMTDEKALAYLSRNNIPVGIYFIYRILEISFALFTLIITSPFLAIALTARFIEDGRPLFFNHERVGKNGKIFTVYKIRSMIKTAESATGAAWADKKDSRITTLGNILRKTHIDEVPQMVNIIKGDIALVGPRPERPEFVAQLEEQIPYYFLRHSIRPGFTGWAQIKYRYARTINDSKEKFEYDLYYIKNGSPLLDIGIVLKTLQIIFTH